MKSTPLFLALAVFCGAGTSQAVIVATTTHADGGFGNEGTIINQIANDDILQLPGVTVAESNAATGWHGANPNASERTDSLTDGIGPVSGVTGLLNDFAGAPVNSFTYTLADTTDLRSISLIGGNSGGDGRIFMTFTLEVSTDNGANFDPLGGFVPGIGDNANGYYQSDASGVVNVSGNAGNISGDPNNPFEETRVLVGSTDGLLAAGVTDVRVSLYSVDNSGGQNRDPFDGVNPFTGVDDTLTAAFSSPLVWEIDVTAVPEPAAVNAIALLAFAMVRRRAA